MAETWPPSLQQKLNQAQFKYGFGNTTIRSDTDTGPVKVRARFTKGVDILSCSINLKFADFTTFETFFKTNLNGGAGTFTFNHPFTGVPTVFRFKEPPQIDPLGGLVFSVSMSWEKMP